VKRTAAPNVIAGLAARLTDSQDRETYSALVSYINELPPGDEFRQLTEMLGLLSLMGQRLPDALGEFLAELRSQTKATADYHGQVDARLAELPREIAAGVDLAAIATAMSEVFRQQIKDTGIADVTGQLKLSTGEIKSLADDASARLKPAASEIRGVTAAISTEVRKLVTAARGVEEHNARLVTRERSNRWGMLSLAMLVVFLVGGLCGILVEKRQTVDALVNIGAQIERVQTPATLPIADSSRKNGKRGL
jgi:hypothetical protein